MIQPHPATFILFRPPMTPGHDEEDVFHAEVETCRERSLDYKRSCPALMGTASRKLARIHERLDEQQDESLSEADGESDSEVPTPVIHPSRRHSSSNSTAQGVTKTLLKKRSFLLVDVLDSVEGRASPKRQHLLDSCSILSNDSIEISNRRPGNERYRPLKRQKSDFDVLYASSKGTQKLSQDNRVASHEFSTETTSHISSTTDASLWSEIPHSSRQMSLRSKKSMITMSLESNRTSSSAKSKLDRIDMDEMTSFDKVLQSSLMFKTTVAAPQLNTLPQLVTSFPCQKPVERVREQSRFSKNTELLREMPATKTNIRNERRLRHSKSAKEVLQKYSAKENSMAKQTQTKPCVVDLLSDPEEKKHSSKKVALRSSLRSLLGLRK